MRSHALAGGLAVCALGFSFAACGSDTVTVGSGAGGSGGATASSTVVVSSSSVSSTAASSSSGGNACSMGSLCDQACCKIDMQCGFGAVCGFVPDLDCNDSSSDCPAQCVLDATCPAIATLATGSPDPDLQACMQQCSGQCSLCVSTNCGAQLQTCQANQTCLNFVNCATACPNQQCIDACLTNNPGSDSDAVYACAEQNCEVSCNFSGAGGAGGSGGASGTGGSGGSGGS